MAGLSETPAKSVRPVCSSMSRCFVDQHEEKPFWSRSICKKYGSHGKFVLKASNWSRSIKETSNNKKNLVTSFVTRTEAFRGGGLKISLIDYASKRGWGIKCLTTLQTVDKMTPK